MPEMDLGDIRSLNLTGQVEKSDKLFQSGWRLFAYLNWPNDDSMRKRYLATLGAQAIANAENLAPDIDLPSVTPEILEQARRDIIAQTTAIHFTPHGGYQSVALAPGLVQLVRATETVASRWVVAGKTLTIIRQIAKHHPKVRGGASVAKAIDLQVRFTPGGVGIRDRTRLYEAWEEFKSVAHVSAAMIRAAILAKAAAQSDRDELLASYPFFQGLGITLAVALDYENFGTKFRSHGQARPILVPDRIWSVPTGLSLPPAGSITPGPLPPEHLDWLKRRIAPKRLSD